jgi:thiosulfate reductase cytochrome b subunit
MTPASTEPAPVAAAVAAPVDNVPRVKVPLRERFTSLPLLSKILLGSAAALVIAGIVIIAARLIAGIPAVASFIVTYPGASELPSNAPTGIPPWLGWQHFFNVFLMVLIIRTGITIRREQRPGAYWAPRRNPTAKVSLTVWLHQSMDILWLVNGVIFVVLLFVTGQWMKIVPTNWNVIPNAISAGLQYATLNWPTENGWVNFNSLQVLAYFTIVFLAAPLAAVTGYRMSGMWPTKARKLNAVYPMEWARAIHFPVMIFFCAFIAVHVFLVFTTGALRNLNHMYASQDVVNWTGFWIFTASLVVMAGVWFAVRPLVIAPIARLFGPVTSR